MAENKDESYILDPNKSGEIIVPTCKFHRSTQGHCVYPVIIGTDLCGKHKSAKKCVIKSCKLFTDDRNISATFCDFHLGVMVCDTCKMNVVYGHMRRCDMCIMEKKCQLCDRQSDAEDCCQFTKTISYEDMLKSYATF